MSASLIKAYTGLTTTGAQAPQPGSGMPFNVYALQVKGQGGTVTSFSAVLEGSLDGLNWTTVCGPATTPDGVTVFAVDKPATWVRANLTALSLGTATSVSIYMTAGSQA